VYIKITTLKFLFSKFYPILRN